MDDHDPVSGRSLIHGLTVSEVIERLTVQVCQADERGDAAMLRAHAAEAEVERLTAELDSLKEGINRTWFVLKDAGVHPGRTDDHLHEVVGWLRDELDALRKDAARIDWIERAARAQRIEIAKSILGTGFEIAEWPSMTVRVINGTLRDAIDASIKDST